ncbi:hypothetical protein [Dissulfurispira sp.]|uniref:hypothetical protein n=1 Tax=Dissulfurispira sp. TaxID=2817609 RepID=UPI002FD9B28C
MTVSTYAIKQFTLNILDGFKQMRIVKTFSRLCPHMNAFFGLTILFILVVLFHVSTSFALTDDEIFGFQSEIKDRPVGERIAFWAERFVGVPYDIDPKGEYVAKGVIVADERVDCMYLTFRAVELALSNNHGEAIEIALDKRFHTKGILKDNKVINYDDRFEYGEDMIFSGKWGKDITRDMGRTVKIEGSRGLDSLPPGELMKEMQKLKSGDIIFFIKNPEKRISEEIVGHIGIIKTEVRRQKTEDRQVYLIHASGLKGRGGVVKKVLFKDYIRKMPFIGVRITRFD